MDKGWHPLLGLFVFSQWLTDFIIFNYVLVIPILTFENCIFRPCTYFYSWVILVTSILETSLLFTCMVGERFPPSQWVVCFFCHNLVVHTVPSCCYSFFPSGFGVLRNNFLKQCCRLCNIIISGPMFRSLTQL